MLVTAVAGRERNPLPLWLHIRELHMQKKKYSNRKRAIYIHGSAYLVDHDVRHACEGIVGRQASE